jgi:uncharacterized membrane protein YhhN
MKNRWSSLTGLVVAAAIMPALLGEMFSHRWLTHVGKPLASIFILALAIAHWRAQRTRYALWIAIGALLALVGDVVLLWPDRYFVLGLAAFLVVHVAYLIAFTRNVPFPARPVMWLIYLGVAAGFYALLHPNLPSNLKAPVAVYAVFLTTMAAQAMGRFLILTTRMARLAAIGAIFFMLSDLLLAFDRFHTALLFAPVLILVPYYLAQWLIACSSASE